MKLRYTQRAAAELDEILDYIAHRSPDGARHVQKRIRTIAALLVRHPESGQQTSVRRLRRIVATPYPYLLFYETVGDEVIVIGVRHASRDPATMPANKR